MADYRYNLSQLFSATFGINAPIFITEPLPFDKRENANLDYNGIKTIDHYYDSEKSSSLGTPILGLLKFKAGEYQSYYSDGTLGLAKYQDFYLPASTLFFFRRSKNITKTNLLGSNGTIKEIFGFDDWIIDVKGLALDDEASSAREKIMALEEWVDIAGAISIESKLFSTKKITNVVIDDYKQEAVQGSPGIIPFTMTFLSDEAIELILPDINI